MTTALLLIDIQNDYFSNGCFPLPDMDNVSATCTKILNEARAHNLPIVHIRHEFPAGKGPFLCAKTQGVDTHKSVAPIDNETVIIKQFPNSFHQTSLQDHLKGINCDHLVVIGAMTQMCVDATTRAALDLGYQVTICADGVASQTVDAMGEQLTTKQVNAAFLSALAMAQARIALSHDVISEWH